MFALNAYLHGSLARDRHNELRLEAEQHRLAVTYRRAHPKIGFWTRLVARLRSRAHRH